VQAFGEALGARFNGLWEQRQSAAWEARHGISYGEYQTHFEAKVRNGLRLRCISAYIEGGAMTYATLWDQEPSPAWEAHHGIRATDYQIHFNAMVDHGFRPLATACSAVLLNG
jgi:hypothetical protein